MFQLLFSAWMPVSEVLQRFFFKTFLERMPVVKRGVLSYLFWLQGTIKLIYETRLGGIPIPALQNRNSTLVERSLYASMQDNLQFLLFFFSKEQLIIARF